jgi:hypothetical protein
MMVGGCRNLWQELTNYISLCIVWQMLIFKKVPSHCTEWIIQGVALPTIPGISLIIPTPVMILQRNLNRSTFVVWEKWRHNNMRWKWPPFASRQDWIWRAIFWKVLVTTFPNDKHSLLQSIPIHFPSILCEFTIYTNTHTLHSAKWQRSAETRQVGNRLANWRTAAPCPNN